MGSHNQLATVRAAEKLNRFTNWKACWIID